MAWRTEILQVQAERGHGRAAETRRRAVPSTGRHVLPPPGDVSHRRAVVMDERGLSDSEH